MFGFVQACGQGRCSGLGFLQARIGASVSACRRRPSLCKGSEASSGCCIKGIVRCIEDTIRTTGAGPLCPPAGFESVAVNEALLTLPLPWEVGSSWRWDNLRHINALETEAAVTVLRSLAKEGCDQRPVLILDSSCARGALAKGRSSARLLRPSLRRSAAICVAGGLFPAFVFGPTRLNVSDDPTRLVPLRTPSLSSAFEGLCAEAVVDLCQFKGAAKNRASRIACATAFLLKVCSGPG